MIRRVGAGAAAGGRRAGSVGAFGFVLTVSVEVEVGFVVAAPDTGPSRFSSSGPFDCPCPCP